MRMDVTIKIAAALVAVSLCAGCFGKREMKRCHKPQEYQDAKPGPRVRVPDEMKQLPEDERLRYPYGQTQNQPVPKGQPCLEEPPTF